MSTEQFYCLYRKNTQALPVREWKKPVIPTSADLLAVLIGG
jgi:hypothetical protein